MSAPPPFTPKVQIAGGYYFPAPYSLHPLPRGLRHGLISVGLLATLSVGCSLTLICFIMWRLVRWKLHYRTFLGYNQYVILVLNLLLADLQQSTAFLITFHWVRANHIVAPSAPCFAQAWLLHSGNMGSGFFVLGVALHTYYTAVVGRRLGIRAFTAIILGIWLFSYFLTAVGVFMYGDKYFASTRGWCWIPSAFQTERLALHYIWVFLVQFGTVLIYIVTFIKLRQKTRQIFKTLGHNAQDSPCKRTVEAVNRVTKLMTLYPCVYVLLTLPLSAGRMWTMAHNSRSQSDTFTCVAGGMLTSCGWVDSILYTLTRRQLLKDTMPSGASSRRAESQTLETAPGIKGITHTRTVTVEGVQLDDPDPHKSRTRASICFQSSTACRRPSSHPDRVDHISVVASPLDQDVHPPIGLRKILDDEGRLNDVAGGEESDSGRVGRRSVASSGRIASTASAIEQ